MHVGGSIFGGVNEAIDAFIDEVMSIVDPGAPGAIDDTYGHDVALWARDKLGIDLEEYQREIAESVVANRLTAVPSCHGAGKSYLAAIIIVWWLTTRENAFVVWTAPRWKQVRAVVGRYVRRLLKQVDVGLTLLETMELKNAAGEMVGMGVSPGDNDDNGINGIHEDNVLIVVDEADGVKPAVWAGVRSFMSGEKPGTMSRLLAIGNPIVPQSYFHGVVTKPQMRYVVHRIDGLRLPTMSRSAVEEYPELAAVFEAEGLPYASESDALRAASKGIATPALFAEWLLEWGTDNPYWHSKVRGVHPPASKRQMFTQAMLEKAWELTIDPAPDAPRCYGFDIAEEGGDETVGYLWHGGRARKVYSGKGGATPGVDATRAVKQHTHTFERVAIDANGTGRGVYETLLADGWQAINHKGSHSARQPDVYMRRKDELFYGLQRDMQQNLVDLDPEDVILAGQLLGIRWKHADKLQVETRREREQRGEDSPDRADALAIARGYAVGATHVPRDGTAGAGGGSGDGWTGDDALMEVGF